MTDSTSAEQRSLEERCRRLENQISPVKHISSLRKSLLELREKQVKGLISKLKFYEVLVSEEREARHSLSNRLDNAESQCGQLTQKLAQNLQTIEELKATYENKVSTLINEIQTSEQKNQQLSAQLNCAQLRIFEVTKDNTMEELARKLDETSKMLHERDRLAKELQKQMKRILERNKMLSYQMSLLNNLFSETEGVTIDFEKIKTIGDIVRESQTYADETEEILSDEEFSEGRPSVDLEDLLESMEKSENVIQAEIPGEESCYKSVDTKRGPQLVLSVSRTFIKLKDLILEKKSLQKEIDTLKNLNTKLESKVDKQEHRLYRVTMELNKTWSLVSKLKQQHKRLYNSEAVLRYELQEKRALLVKLRNELSASREKWRRVRQKNSQSQVEWEKLRDEFAQRKHESSQESGAFSEAMSVSSSGENDAPVFEEEDGIRERNRNGGADNLEKSQTLPKSFTTTIASSDDTNIVECSNVGDDEPDAPEYEEEDGAGALSPAEDETSGDDPLEELVSQLVEDIDNEPETEEESSSSSKVQLETTFSSSPDFEDRMKRRADRLRMLEEQCHSLHKKLIASTERSVTLSTKLAQLHEHYGPSDAKNTGSPNDEKEKDPQASKQGDAQTSHSQDEVPDGTNSPLSCGQADGASATATESECNGIEEKKPQNVSNSAELQEPKQSTKDNSEDNIDQSSSRMDEASTANNLISSSENSSIVMTMPKETENNRNPSDKSNLQTNISDKVSTSVATESQSQLQLSQGHNCNGNGTERPANMIPDTLLTIAEERPGPGNGNGTQNLSVGNQDITSSVVVGTSTTDPPPPSQPSRDVQGNILPDNDNTVVNLLNCDCEPEQPSTNPPSLLEMSTGAGADVPNQLQAQIPPTPAAPEQSSELTVEIQETDQSQASVDLLTPVDDEPVPIIQETVVQHFPPTTEEEANEFAPMQIRPEFLRILQEADEATNASSLDWMPSLLTTSVALLRLDHDSPATTRTNNNNSRSLSESLRIEIPGQSPSPPPATFIRSRHRPEENRGRISGTNQNDNGNGHVSADEDGEERVPRKDPGFLSRMIIKQLPKRLQLLKNENHTLQMEAAEGKMRMKEMTRQLTKELERQQQLAAGLDAQIEDKNLIEFELREELGKKEKVIEELQIEIDESKKYIDEMKREKDEMEASLKACIEEKIDLNKPKALPDSTKNCNNCERPFLLLRRRKVHCKICGQIFCKDCALEREPNIRSSKRPRLCTRCHLRRLRLVVLVNASKQSSSQAK